MRRGLTTSSVLLGLVYVLGAMATAQAPAEQEILLSELLTKGQDNQKFIELYNPGDAPVKLKDWKIHRHLTCSGAASTSTLVALSGEIQPRGYFLVAKPGVAERIDIEHSLNGLCADYGRISLIGAESESGDSFSWGPEAAEQTANPFVKLDSDGEVVGFVSGESFKRKVDEDGNLIDTDDDWADFFASVTPSPESTSPPPLETDGFQPSRGSSDPEYDPDTLAVQAGVKNKKSAKLEITELLIDPGKPLTDAEDEFVEIHNPTAEAVDLGDYAVKTGSSFSYNFTLPSLTLGSGQYLALFSIDTGLVLSNSGGAARLIGPDGEAVYETPPYSDAEANTAWAKFDDGWQWTTQPTPNSANTLSQENNEGSTLGSGSSARGDAAYGADTRTVYEEPPDSAEAAKVNNAVVAGVGGMALLYAGYEYRYDLGNRIHQLRRYLAARRGGGTET